ncbi:hypothetical protein [Bacillus sp. AK031]
MKRDVYRVYSSESELSEDLKMKENVGTYEFLTVDPEQYKSLQANTSLKGKLLNVDTQQIGGGIHGLATAFDEDDGSVELTELGDLLLKEGFSKEDATRCKVFLHKRMIVVSEKV